MSELICAECQNPFEFSEGEEAFLRERFGEEFQPPKYCKPCRKMRKEKREARGAQGDRCEQVPTTSLPTKRERSSR